MNEILRRKVLRGSQAGADGSPGADHGWRLALARAARDATGLLMTVEQMGLARRSLAELLELPPDRALVALLEGPGGGLGMIALSPGVTAALIGMQTVGRVPAPAASPRRPTRIDAAMASAVIDRALIGLEEALAEEADRVWAGGFRYGSFLEDIRPLGLLLDDQPYRVLDARLSLGEGGGEGRVILALPAEGKGRLPPPRPVIEAAPAGPVFSQALGQLVLQSDCVLGAVIARTTLPLSAVMGLAPDQILPLLGAALDRVEVQGVDGRPVATARLGQHRGMRALRLTEIGPPASRTAPAQPAQPPAAPAVSPGTALKATG